MMEFTAGKIVHKDELNNMARQQKFGVISGCETTADSPASLNVIVSAGEYLIDGVKYTTLGDTITITPDATYNSSATILLDTSGVVSVEYGALSLNDDTTGKPLPTYDYDPDTHLPIARIFVGGGVSAISQSNIKSLKIENGAVLLIDENKFNTVEMSYLESTDSNDSFTDSDASLWNITNVGANNVYLNFGASATTNNFYLKPNENIIINLNQTQLNYICDTGETTDISIISGQATNNKFSNFISKNVSISDSSTEIYDDTASYKEWIIFNDGVEDVFLNFGASAAITNYKLKSGKYLLLTFESNQLYGITASGTATVRIIGLRM